MAIVRRTIVKKLTKSFIYSRIRVTFPSRDKATDYFNEFYPNAESNVYERAHTENAGKPLKEPYPILTIGYHRWYIRHFSYWVDSDQVEAINLTRISDL